VDFKGSPNHIPKKGRNVTREMIGVGNKLDLHLERTRDDHRDHFLDSHDKCRTVLELWSDPDPQKLPFLTILTNSVNV
jgi:hypothetical protein